MPLNRGGIADLPLLKRLLAILEKSWERPFWEVMEYIFFVGLCKFGSFKNPFAMIKILSELYFRIRRFILLVQMKKLISMNSGSSTSCWKPWRLVRHDLIFSMRDICSNLNLNPLTKFTNSSRSLEFEDILPWRNSQMITISTRIAISYAMKRGIPLWIWWKFSGNWDNNMIRISLWREAILEQILASEEINKSKRAGLWKSQSGIRVGKLIIWVRSFEIEKL